MTGTIVLFTDSHVFCGVGRVNNNLSRAFTDAGFRVICAQRREDTPVQRELLQLGIEFRWSDIDPVKYFAEFAADTKFPNRVFEEVSPDLVFFSNGAPMGSLAAVQTAGRRGIPYMTRDGLVAPSLLPRQDPGRALLRQNYLGAHKAIFNCAAHQMILAKLLDLPEDLGLVIATGADAHFFEPTDIPRRRQYRAQLGLTDDDILCVTTAEFKPVKGYDILVAAMAQLQSQPTWERVHFALAGQGALREEIETKARELGVADHVHFLGHVWNVAELYDGGDIFVLPSHFEGISNSLVEAMAKGLPVVATKTLGSEEALDGTGILVNLPTDPNRCAGEIAQAITTWVNDPIARGFAAKQCRKKAAASYRNERLANQIIAAANDAIS